MKKKTLFLLLMLIFLLPIHSFGVSNYVTEQNNQTFKYNDSVANIVNVPIEDGKINLYFFYGDGCHTCEDFKEFLSELENSYSDFLNIYSFETWNNTDNQKLLEDSAIQFGYTKSHGVPVIVINNKMFGSYEKKQITMIITNFINDYTKKTSTPAPNNTYDLPILGTVNAKNVSVPLVAIILGFIDGFNPCAMWILLLLISMFLGMQNRKKALILGITFLFISALVYFLSMFGINYILDIFNYANLKALIALFIFIAGVLNFKKYLKLRKADIGCEVINNKKRKSIINKLQKIISNNTLFLSLVGIIILAINANSLELLCSLGFPVIFSEILSLNGFTGIYRSAYILLYVFFYMLDDIIVFTISMLTLKATGITNKYNKLCTFISSIIMIVIAILLIFKPSWLMLSF